MLTFLMTDVEGSSRHWEQRGAAMRAALRLHDDLVRRYCETEGGDVVTAMGEGDSFFVVFREAGPALAAAAGVQRSVAVAPWPADTRLRVRMAVHSGDAGPDYRGPTANQCARIRACAHGGQVVVSETAASQAAPPAGTRLRSLGEHRLRDTPRPQRLFQLEIEGLPNEFPPLRSLGAFSHNLPTPATSFVGRERHVAEIRRWLAADRLVTLTGPGGCGKTRLALQVAAGLVDAHPGGVWFVAIASESDPGTLPQVVAAALGARDETGGDPLDRLVERLRERPALLLLDNCEHLIGVCADLARTLLVRCPELRILVTSREVLNIGGERTWTVSPLAVPDRDAAWSPADLARVEAVALLFDRGVSARSSFTLTEANAPAVAEICRRLEGIPLAIELAAARLRVLSPGEILRRLEKLFELLTEGARDSPGRHRTLWAAMDWSYQLLRPPEHLLFERLSTFTDGWSLEAAEEVCADEVLAGEQVLNVMQRLVDKSLVTATEQGDATRYGMLETLREYGRERLAERGEVDRFRQRHLDYFTRLAERLDTTSGGEESACLPRLETDHLNLLLALETGQRTDRDAVVRLAGALAWFWSAAGRVREGVRWLEVALAAPAGRSGPRAHALRGLARLRWHQGDYAAARILVAEALTSFEALGDRLSVARCNMNLGILSYAARDFDSAIEHYSVCLPVFRELGDARLQAIMLANLGLLRTERHELDEGRRLLDEAMELHQRLGHRALVTEVLAYLGVNALYRGDLPAARAAFSESLGRARELGQDVSLTFGLEGFALLAAAECQRGLSLRLAAALGELRRRIGAVPSPVFERRRRRWLQPAEEAMTPQEAAIAHQQGTRLTLEEALDLALSSEAPDCPRCDAPTVGAVIVGSSG